MNSTSSRQALPDLDDSNLLVIAPPGCGKTELLARRAEALIETLRTGQRILALTFSNKAKANLNARLLGVLGPEKMRRYVTVHNFHGHAAEVVRAHGRTVGTAPDAPFPEKNTQYDAVSPFLEGLTEKEAGDLRKELDAQLRDAKQGPYSDDEVLERLYALRDDRAHTIETERQATGGLFFDDLLRHAQRLLRVREVAILYNAHYGALLVDEFQDLSPQQLDIALRTCTTSRTFVGDPLQGIYSWTGARPKMVERLLRRISGDPASLGVSYRSSPNVLKLLGKVSENLGGLALDAHDPDDWFEGGIAAGGTFETGIAEADFVRDLTNRILTKQPNATIGIICRSGWRRKPIDVSFASSGTLCVRWELALDNSGVVDVIRRAISRLGEDATADELATHITSALGAADVDTAVEVLDALSQLETLAADGGTISSALGAVRSTGSESEAIPPGVHLLNAHTGKGQQFDWVIIPGFENGNVPSFLAHSEAELEEEYRVLLVMLSRARHGVVLTRANSLISKNNKPYDTRPSPWAGDIRPGLNANLEELQAHIARLPRPVEQE